MAQLNGPVANMGGFLFGLGGSHTGVYTSASYSRRNAPMQMFEDTLSWSKGSHGLSFGGSWFNNAVWTYSKPELASVSFGLSNLYDPAYVMFDATNGPTNFPGATASNITTAQSLYAVLTGRVTAINGTAYRNENSGKYEYLGPLTRRSHQREYGFFAQDSWRMRPGLTLTFGARWELLRPWAPSNNAFSWASPEDVWGPSGPDSIFKPGASGGKATEVHDFLPGTASYKPDYKTVAPSVGFAWTPKEGPGWLGRLLLGNAGQTVLRGGYSTAFTRQSVGSFVSVFSSNPGGTISANRTQDIGNLIVGNMTYPVLFRDKSKLGPPPFQEAPIFPLAPTIDGSISALDPDLRTPYTMSWTFGIQRELTRDTAIEVRYVGNASLKNWYGYNINERNIIENGFLDEFKLAQANVYANLTAGRGKNFRYYGPNTGTFPLPIMMKYLGANIDPNIPGNYLTTGPLGSVQGGIFTNSTYNDYLSTWSPAPYSLASVMDSDAIRRTNALTAGLPANFFMVNPDVKNGGAYIYRNAGRYHYDSMQVEVRRRMAKGLMLNASYVFAKGFIENNVSFRRPYQKSLSGVLPHVFKATWLYELPFGNGKALFSGAGGVLNRIIGSWEFHGTTRIQCCNILNFGSVRLVGMTLQELRDSVALRFDDVNKKVYYLPQDIIDQSYKAYQYNTSLTTFTQGAPTGRYIAPAQSGGCINIATGDCAPYNTYVNGPHFMRFDMSLVKRIRLTEKKSFELRGEFLNAFNNINFYGVASAGSLTSGQVTSAYQDSAQQQDNGGRMIQIVMRFNF